MPKPVVVYLKVIDSLNTFVWKVVRWVVVFNIALLLYETFTRYALNRSCIWSTELLEHTIVGGFILCGGYILLRGEHVRMDAFWSRWSPKTKAIVDIAGFALFVYIIVMVVTFVPSTIHAIKFGQVSPSPWRVPYWPIKAVLGMGALLLLLQGIATLIRDIATVMGKRVQ